MSANLLQEAIDALLDMDCADRDEVVATVGDVVTKLRLMLARVGEKVGEVPE